MMVFPNVRAIVDMVPVFKVGDPPPSGYMAWFEWAEAQHKGGLRQRRCGHCNKWKFPQELSGDTVVLVKERKMRKSPGVQTRKFTMPVCVACKEAGGKDAAP